MHAWGATVVSVLQRWSAGVVIPSAALYSNSQPGNEPRVKVNLTASRQLHCVEILTFTVLSTQVTKQARGRRGVAQQY